MWWERRFSCLFDFAGDFSIGQIWSLSGRSRDMRIQAVSMAADAEASSHLIPAAPIFLPQGPWSQVCIFFFPFIFILFLRLVIYLNYDSNESRSD